MDSYEVILQRMKDKYCELSGFEVPELSDIDIRLKVLAGEIFNNQVNLDFIKRQMFPKTATGEYLDLHAADRGLSRKESVKAIGKVKFYISTAIEENLEIPQGTIVATSGSASYRFVTDADAVIAAGTTSVTVPCTAEKGGSGSNVLAESINVLVTTITGVAGVTNTAEFSGGTDEENDENLRARILDSYITISNGTNKAYYKKLALSVPGVTGATVVPRERGVGTVNVYICSNKEEANSTLVKKVQTLMETQREVNVDVRVYTASPIDIDLILSISVNDGYDFNAVSNNVKQALNNYINSLSIGDDILATHLGKVILSVEGVYNYMFDSIQTSDYYLDNNSFAVMGNVAITEVVA